LVAASTDTLGNKVILTPFIAQTLQARKADEDRQRYSTRASTRNEESPLSPPDPHHHNH